MDVEIKINAKALEKVISRLHPRALDKVLRKTLTVAAKTAHRSTVKEIGGEYNLPRKRIAVGVRTRYPSALNPESSVTVRPQPIGLEQFRARQIKRGVKVKVSKRRGAETLPHTFKAPIQGKEKVLVRTRKLTPATKQYVLFPSKQQPKRGKSGGELPINRLFADPTTEVVRPKAQRIGQEAADTATVHMVVMAERLIDKGQG